MIFVIAAAVFVLGMVAGATLTCAYVLWVTEAGERSGVP